MSSNPMLPELDTGPREHDDDPASRVTRFGTAVGAGLLAAIGASLPAVLRIADGVPTARGVEVWGGLAALYTPLAIAAVILFRQARVGVRLAVGTRGALVAATVLGWSVFELVLLSVFGAVLRAKTHHLGLAGVTFAAFALVTGAVTALLAVRGARALSRVDERVQRAALGLAAAATFVALVLVGARTAQSAELGTASALVDILAVVVASFLASTHALARVKGLALAGVPATAIVVVLGLSAVRSRPSLQAEISVRAPVHAWLLATVARDDGSAP